VRYAGRIRRFAQISGFVLLTAVLLVGALAASSRLLLGEYTLLQGLTRIYEAPGGRFQALRRFREAEGRGPVDIALLGASHTYRGYDPRLFEAAGHRVMILGSTAQTPLNGYYVAERYLPILEPRLVVLEVFHGTLANDGLESSRDLLVNTPWSWSMQRMALATWNLGAAAFAAAKGFGFAGSEAHAEQREIEGETYVAGGYCESPGRRTKRMDGGPLSFTVLPRQLAYLRATSDLARKSGAQVLWVSHPLPRDYLDRIDDRAGRRRAVDDEAARAGVEYWDFSEMDLDPLEHFKDPLHMNAEGVARFDAAFIERLTESGRLSPR
jgi:hypothetical protein